MSSEAGSQTTEYALIMVVTVTKLRGMMSLRCPSSGRSWPMRAGIYVRISRAADGSTLGLERQEPPCRALCERNGWEAAEVYSDNDLSAFNGHRPGYQRLLADAKAGRIGAIVAWDADRLTRQPIENEDLIDLAERAVPSSPP
jgi:DNA invertase Pin-like site-specific DNA recombinase